MRKTVLSVTLLIIFSISLFLISNSTYNLNSGISLKLTPRSPILVSFFFIFLIFHSLLHRNKKSTRIIKIRILLLVILSISVLLISNSTFFNSSSSGSSSNLLTRSLASLSFFFLFTSIYFAFYQNEKTTRKIKFRILLLCLLFFPTLNSHIKIECDIENQYNTYGETAFKSNRQFITISPFLVSFFKLFEKQMCEKSGDYWMPSSKYSLSVPFKQIPYSNLYFIHFISILFNSILIVYIISHERRHTVLIEKE